MVDIVTYRWDQPWEYIATRAYGKPGVLYTEEHVNMTHRMIRKNMSLPFQIYHYSRDGADKVGDDVISCEFVDEYPGWYQFFSFMRRERPYLFISLDNVIVDDLAPFVEYARGKGFHTSVDPCDKSCYTGVCWIENCQEYADLFDEFFHSDDFTTNDKKWHDEMFIERKIVNYGKFPTEWICSYKRQYLRKRKCREAKIYMFNGFPKHYEVNDIWVKDALKGGI